MFTLEKSQVDNINLLTLMDQDSKASLSLIPQLGAALHSLAFVCNGELNNILTPWDRPLLSTYRSSYIGSQLFPFPNRLRQGLYSYQDNDYRFPINEPSRDNALHGHLAECCFELESFDEELGKVKLFYRQEPTSAFPWSYHIENTFKLRRNRLEISTSITNTDRTRFPYGHGWHPYFFDDINLKEYNLKLPKARLYTVDNKMIPTGAIEDYDTFLLSKTLGTTELDTCFVLDDDSSLELIYPDALSKLVIEPGDYRYLQIYIPPSRDHIAIEPQTCIPNALQNGIGLRELDPNETHHLNTAISLLQSEH